MADEIGINREFRPIDRSGHELLVVDDDPVSRYATVRLLQRAGFKTREAASGLEGLAAVDDRISALVLDVHLPDIDGFELCRRLRSHPRWARLPVLHLTAAFVTDEDKVRGLDSGADAYLTHPVEPAVLVATVQALVRTRVAEEAMRRSEAKFRTIYAQVPAGICLLDAEGRFLDANPAMLGFLDRPAAEVIGRRVSDFAADDERAAVERYLAGAAEAGSRMEFALLARSGARLQLEWTVTRHADANTTLAVASDVSHRLELERQRQELMEGERMARSAAERVSRMKDELIAVLSHELRTPLNAITGWTHVLQKRGGNDETRRGLDAIERNARVQARLISDILDMSRLNTGKMPLHFELVDPKEAVVEAVNALRPSLEENGHVLALDTQDTHAAIRADTSRLQQVVWNLVSNAIKFSPHGSEVRVSLRDVDDGFSLEVADQGQGIEPAFLPLLFDRFTQSDVGSSRKRGGLGLGLSIVKHLVEAHGGHVRVESDGAGRGSRFTVWLPQNPQAPRRAEAFDPPLADDAGGDDDAGTLNGLHVLVVDDDPDANAMLAIILSDRGAIVTTAGSCDEALATLRTLQPDVLVSDVGMPGKDGYELVREIRRRERERELEGGGEGEAAAHLQAVALTSFTRSQDEARALEAGFDLHCAKPLRPMKLIQAIQFLAGRGSFMPTR